MYKCSYLFLLIISPIYGCQVQQVPLKQVWEKCCISTQQMRHEGVRFLGEETVNKILAGEAVDLPAHVVHSIVKKVNLRDEQDLFVATNFLRLVSAFDDPYNYFNGSDKIGRSPLYNLLLRKDFLAACDQSALYGFLQEMRNHTAIPSYAHEVDRLQLTVLFKTMLRDHRTGAQNIVRLLGIHGRTEIVLGMAQKHPDFKKSKL